MEKTRRGQRGFWQQLEQIRTVGSDRRETRTDIFVRAPPYIFPKEIPAQEISFPRAGNFFENSLECSRQTDNFAGADDYFRKHSALLQLYSSHTYLPWPSFLVRIAMEVK